MQKCKPHAHWFNLLTICVSVGVVLSTLVAWGSAYIENEGMWIRIGVIEDPTSFPPEDARSRPRDDILHFYSAPRRSDGWYYWELHDGSEVKIFSSAFDVATLHLTVPNQIVAMPFGQGPSWSIVQHPPTAAQIYSGLDLLEEARGWPMPCAVSVITTNRFRVSWSIVSGIQFGSHSIYPACPRVLPIKPIWFGLFVDTIFYGVVVWILIRILRSIRSMIRIRRGFCGGCGYIMHTLKQCPECGLEQVKVRQSRS